MKIRNVTLASLIAAMFAGGIAAPDVASAQTPVTAGFRVSAPGYLLLDGRWYIFSGPFFTSNLEAFPLGTGNGFDLNAWATAAACAPNPPNPPPPNVAPFFRLREGSTVTAFFPMAPSPLGGAEIRLANCEGINLIGIRSSSGRMACTGEITNPPFNTTNCPVITKLLGPTSDLLLSNGFEAQ